MPTKGEVKRYLQTLYGWRAATHKLEWVQLLAEYSVRIIAQHGTKAAVHELEVEQWLIEQLEKRKKEGVADEQRGS